MTVCVYTIKHLEGLPADQRPRGEQVICHEGKLFHVFICHGCQSCWQWTDERCTELVESYPHFLSSQRIDPTKHGS